MTLCICVHCAQYEKLEMNDDQSMQTQFTEFTAVYFLCCKFFPPLSFWFDHELDMRALAAAMIVLFWEIWAFFCVGNLHFQV